MSFISPLDELDNNAVAMFKSGDHKDYLKLYNKYAPAVMGVLLRTLGDKEIAEKCVNNAFFEIWSRRLSYNPEKERLFTWMLKISRTCAKCACLSEKKYLDDEIREEIDLVYAMDIQAYLKEKKHIEGASFASKVTAQIREAINLIYFQGYSFSAAAEHLGLSVEQLRAGMIKNIKQLKGEWLS